MSVKMQVALVRTFITYFLRVFSPPFSFWNTKIVNYD